MVNELMVSAGEFIILSHSYFTVVADEAFVVFHEAFLSSP